MMTRFNPFYFSAACRSSSTWSIPSPIRQAPPLMQQLVLSPLIMLFLSSERNFPIIQLFRSQFALMFNTLGLGGGNAVCLFFPSSHSHSNHTLATIIQTGRGIPRMMAAITLGIPLLVWIYYKGQSMCARNPLIQASTIPKDMKIHFTS